MHSPSHAKTKIGLAKRRIGRVSKSMSGKPAVWLNVENVATTDLNLT